MTQEEHEIRISLEMRWNLNAEYKQRALKCANSGDKIGYSFWSSMFQPIQFIFNV